MQIKIRAEGRQVKASILTGIIELIVALSPLGPIIGKILHKSMIGYFGISLIIYGIILAILIKKGVK